jgi:hypothetical protein
MNAFGYILTGTSSVVLLLALIRSGFELSHAKSSFWGCLSVILVSLFLLGTNVRITPGGPFVSVHGDIFPALSCMAVLFFITRDFRAFSNARRIGLSFITFFLFGVIALVVADIVHFSREEFARGVLFAW